MTHRQAKAKLKKLAAGRYHTAQVQITESKTIECYTEYMMYIEGHDLLVHSRLSWENALTLMNEKLS